MKHWKCARRPDTLTAASRTCIKRLASYLPATHCLLAAADEQTFSRAMQVRMKSKKHNSSAQYSCLKSGILAILLKSPVENPSFVYVLDISNEGDFLKRLFYTQVFSTRAFIVKSSRCLRTSLSGRRTTTRASAAAQWARRSAQIHG